MTPGFGFLPRAYQLWSVAGHPVTVVPSYPVLDLWPPPTAFFPGGQTTVMALPPVTAKESLETISTPLRPGSPWSPLSPFSPGAPGAPGMPWAPGAPASPLSPLSPFSPSDPGSRPGADPL